MQLMILNLFLMQMIATLFTHTAEKSTRCHWLLILLLRLNYEIQGKGEWVHLA